jgi:hypothetical protein
LDDAMIAATAASGLRDEVRSAWADALDIDVDAVPQDVSFFEAGGNSLLLLLLWERLSDLTERDLRAADLFQHATVTAQVKLLARGPDTEAPTPASATHGRRALLGRAYRAESAADRESA